MRPDLENRLHYAQEKQHKTVKAAGYWLMIIGFCYLLATLLTVLDIPFTSTWDTRIIRAIHGIAAATGILIIATSHLALNREINKILATSVEHRKSTPNTQKH